MENTSAATAVACREVAGLPGSSLTVREPGPLEVPACYMLLPKAVESAIPYEYRIAVDRASATIAGAVAFGDGGAQVQLLQLHTVSSYRGQGVGTQLVDYVLAEAVRRGRGEVSAAIHPRDGDAIATFLRNRGFARKGLCCVGEGDLAEIYRRQQARCTRVAEIERGDWQILPLSRELLNEAGRVFPEYLGSIKAPYLGGDLSQALLVNGAMQGIFLVTRLGDTALFRLRVVQPQFRSSRASAALHMRAIKACAEAGCRQLCLSYLDTNEETQKLVRRLNLKVTDTAELLVKAVEVTPRDPGSRGIA